MKAGVNAKVVEAFDINDTANDVYQHNFGHRPYQVPSLFSIEWALAYIAVVNYTTGGSKVEIFMVKPIESSSMLYCKQYNMQVKSINLCEFMVIHIGLGAFISEDHC